MIQALFRTAAPVHANEGALICGDLGFKKVDVGGKAANVG